MMVACYCRIKSDGCRKFRQARMSIHSIDAVRLLPIKVPVIPQLMVHLMPMSTANLVPFTCVVVVRCGLCGSAPLLSSQLSVLARDGALEGRPSRQSKATARNDTRNESKRHEDHCR